LLRTHNCGQLRAVHIDQEVTLCGWVDTSRDHGGTLFIDLRDRYGKTQVVFAPEAGQAVLDESRKLRTEDVIRVTGKVAHRPEGTTNPKLDTGEIELRVKQLELLNKCQNAPFFPTAMELPGEDLRLTYRYLDLRRPEMQRTLGLRSDIIMEMRNYFAENDFLDVETPILGRSTPEGARDYLVPSRVHNGLFYALPQSPHSTNRF
jgi:aspartyl-tRNA synthetase